MSKNIALDIEGRKGYLHGTAHQASRKYLKAMKINGKSSDSSLVTALLPALFLQVSVCYSRDEGDIGMSGRDNEHEQRIPGLPA
ncbi:hypothetical protein H112_06478 [Trichophyton rubrum D6]|uniref:Uncharacterized protein n=3 Tax=Trichophyton TaxID=5550 RepID=A0A080WJB2_TRIRC|nr:uncharacterized protein TERG_11766 [Trichophyton rubrum CBS 118892]EZF12935.1 hypothetical protein H100_06492 [Trichophyton rubrum MR850]EZF39451.1 hypothetical protein H102_06459 [Trichophyton rubrum CBS 100081]EZF50047.1 hypothetical protein H103_06486 [Trichophyton rubrum CBS 288.86]EZF60680.1 hypothetical protein H104_06469 [Trichophyton rubrum CBS 289.86]EZF71291.1 hypothetical protein H105_06497 [Trichophyton soudanense CBS 452.61]EZF81984.1 hypothetical protein H110_06481 [Trichophy